MSETKLTKTMRRYGFREPTFTASEYESPYAYRLVVVDPQGVTRSTIIKIATEGETISKRRLRRALARIYRAWKTERDIYWASPEGIAERKLTEERLRLAMLEIDASIRDYVNKSSMMYKRFAQQPPAKSVYSKSRYF